MDTILFNAINIKKIFEYNKPFDFVEGLGERERIKNPVL